MRKKSSKLIKIMMLLVLNNEKYIKYKQLRLERQRMCILLFLGSVVLPS